MYINGNNISLMCIGMPFIHILVLLIEELSKILLWGVLMLYRTSQKLCSLVLWNILLYKIYQNMYYYFVHVLVKMRSNFLFDRNFAGIFLVYMEYDSYKGFIILTNGFEFHSFRLWLEMVSVCSIFFLFHKT